jgi:pheromone shutdown protein TraB
VSTFVTVLVLLAIAFVVSVGLAAGLDVFAAALLGFILLTGVLALAAVRRMGSKRVGPVPCPHCSGVVSLNAPYCKHCGARLGNEEDLRTGGAPAGPERG